MAAKSASCPACRTGSLHRKSVRQVMFGVDLGSYPAEVCSECGEAFLTGESVHQVEARAKELGLWGRASKVKVARSGNSLVVRIPSSLARYLDLKSGQEVTVVPDQKHRLILELS
jgi:YgiT-type zinc finger domain-containing protein